MTGPSYIDRERGIVERLAAAVAERARREKEIAAAYEAAVKAAQSAAEDARSAAASAAGAERAAAELEYRKAGTQLIEQRDRDVAQARLAMETEVSQHEEETASLEAKVESNLDETVWLAETMVESGETKLKTQFEQFRTAFESRMTELSRLRDEADVALQRKGFGGLGEAPASADVAAGGEVGFEEARSEAAAALDLLARRLNPRAMSGLVILAVVMLSAGAGGGVAFAIASVDAASIAMGVGAGLIAATVGLLVMRSVARGRVPQAVKGFHIAFERALRAGEREIAAERARTEEARAELAQKRDREVRKARERHAAIVAKIQTRRRVDLPQIKERHAANLEKLRLQFEARLGEIERTGRARLQSAQDAKQAAVEAAEAALAGAIAAAEKTRFADRTAMIDKEAVETREMAVETVRVLRLAEAAGGAWDQIKAYSPVAEAPSVVPIGSVKIEPGQMPGGGDEDGQGSDDPDEDDSFDLPVALDLYGHASMLVQHGVDGREASLALIRSTMLRLLATLPPGKVRFTLVDPVGLGQSFAGFMHLADYEDGIVGDKIWTETRHIEQRLTDLTEHMENVIQKYLRNEFETIQEYNTHAGEVAEPFRFLVIADFPANFSEASAKRLASIVNSGPKCGVYVLAAADMRQRPPSWAPMAELERAGLRFMHTPRGFELKDDVLGSWPLTLDTAAEEIFPDLIHAIGRATKDSSRVRVPFDLVSPRAGEVWTADAASSLRVPIGRAGATKLQSLELGEGTAQHVLIAGRTGSGKSTLLHALITNTAMWFSPEQVELYLVDFKKGVEFKTYASHTIPHARVIAVESEREFGLSVLRRLDAELTARGQQFREAGVQDLAGFRRAQPDAVMPRTLLIVDEFQEFFVEDDKLAQEASLLLDRLVRQGRAFGMHVVLGSQTIGGAYSLARSTIGQMAVRIALQCSEADSYLILSEDNAAARLLARPGEAIYNDASGRVEGNSPFQVVWLSDETRDDALDRVEAMTRERGVRTPPPVIFEGNAPAHIEANAFLARTLREGIAPSEGGRSLPPAAWLGDAISIKDPTHAVFRRQGASNMLIVGQQETAALAMTGATLISLAAHHAAEQNAEASAAIARGGEPLFPRFTILDGSTPGEDDSHLLPRFAGAMPSSARLATPPGADRVILALGEELERRRADESRARRPIYLVVFGLHRFRSLRKEDEFSFGGDDDAGDKPSAVFATLAREGPMLGVHVIAWCDVANNIDRFLDRRTLREFDLRVLFQMSGTDSSSLIDSPVAGSLGRHRALLFSEETGTIEKFRPYAMPDGAWLAATLQRLAEATGEGEAATQTGRA